jgi:hypothetical protein
MGGVSSPKANAAFCVPAPANPFFPDIKEPPVDQVPTHSEYCNLQVAVLYQIFPTFEQSGVHPTKIAPFIVVLESCAIGLFYYKYKYNKL